MTVDLINGEKERLVQIYFQLNLTTNKIQLKRVIESYDSLLRNAINQKNIQLINYCYKLIAQTRDIHCGKGLYNISYMLLGVWVKLAYVDKIVHPSNIKNVLNMFVFIKDNHSYGSWKDLKYFANYIVYEANIVDKNHNIVHYIAEMYANQIIKDLNKVNYKNYSLVAKWTPRESSNKFGWLVNLISHYLIINNTSSCKNKINKKKYYREIISNLNKKINTVQIKQCNNEWESIHFKNVTNKTMQKQDLAFSYKNKYGEIKGTKNDRLNCSYNYKDYINEQNNQILNCKENSIITMVKNAFFILNNKCIHPKCCNFKQQSNQLELLWNKKCIQNIHFNNYIPIIDVSCYLAMGLGICCSEKSILKNKVFTFSEQPICINMDNMSFINKIINLKDVKCEINNDFEKTYTLILDTFKKSNLEPNSVKNMTLLVFSNTNTIEINEKIFEKMKEKYYPYSVPKIIVWNLKETNMCPIITSNHITGINNILLNTFLKENIDFSNHFNPWTIVLKIIENNRYNNMKFVSF